MIQESDSLTLFNLKPGQAARAAVVLSCLFLDILILLHFLKPELDPSWRMISEYEIGRFGWLMSLAFFCWAGSVLTLSLALQRHLDTPSGKIGLGWMLLISVALVGAGIFKTNAILDDTPNLANTLHTLCGAFVIMTFPIAAALVARSLSQHPAWAPSKRWLLFGTLLLWLGMFVFFGSISVSNAINPAAGRVGPQVYLGWPNRAMVLVYNLWLIVTAIRAAQLHPTPSPGQPH